jgi:acyl-CoA thioester hydrolase
MAERSHDRFSTEITIRARYAETDAMGVVHHASYVIWLEQGRTELLRALGLNLAGIPQYAIFVSAVAAHLSYLEAQGQARVELEDAGMVWRL